MKRYPLFLPTLALCLSFLSWTNVQAGTIDFEDLDLGPANTAVATEFTSGGASFPGETLFDCCWSGWVSSNSTLNQDLAIPPGTVDAGNPLQRAHWSTAYAPPNGATSNYTVSSFVDSEIQPDTARTANNTPFSLPTGETIVSLEVANTTWTAHSMLVGDAFGGPFSDDDFFRLTISGFNGDQETGSVEVSLAEGRNVLDEWLMVSLTDLSGATRLEFALASSDFATFGDTSFLNTPTFFAIDNIITQPVPEPGALSLLIFGGVLIAPRTRVARRGRS